MMMSSSPYVFAFGVAVVGAIAVVSCSSETGGGTASQSSASATTGTPGSSSGSSGNGGSGGGGGSVSSSANGSGGSEGYTSCGDCTDTSNGAPSNECKVEYDACSKDAGCEAIYACVYTAPGCSTDEAGACCTLKCFTDTAATQASIDLYRAYDGCVYCTTCKDLCDEAPFDTTSYCKVFEPGGNTVCP